MGIDKFSFGDGNYDESRVDLKGPEAHPMISKLREVGEMVGPHQAARRDLALSVLKKTMGKPGAAAFAKIEQALESYGTLYERNYMFEPEMAQQLIKKEESRLPLIEAGKELLTQAKAAQKALTDKYGKLSSKDIHAMPRSKERSRQLKAMAAEHYFDALAARLDKLGKRLGNIPIPEIVPDVSKAQLKPKPYMSREIKATAALLLGILDEKYHDQLAAYCRKHVGDVQAEQLEDGIKGLHTALGKFSTSQLRVYDLLTFNHDVQAAARDSIEPVFQEMTRIMNQRSVQEMPDAQRDADHMAWTEMTFLRDQIHTLVHHLSRNLSPERL